LDRRVAFQQSSKSYSPSGELIEGWATLAERWANVHPLLGDERSADSQWVAREQVQFTVRWDSTLQGISPLDRVVFPASDAGASPEVKRSIYDIFAVHELGRHTALQIMAARML
jgi:head-tail adaptor